MLKLFRKTMAVMMVASMTLMPVRSYAQVASDTLPTGFDIPANGGAVLGDAPQIDATGKNMTIDQVKDRLVVDWQTFSIGSAASVTFNQPSASSIALNRVQGESPSEILGRLSANGRIFLVNPNGILFGAGAVVDTAGLLASTIPLNMTVKQFRGVGSESGAPNSFSFSGGSGASIVNLGALTSPGGFVTLLGAHISNVGAIQADMGTVALASGDAVTVGLDAYNTVSIVVNTPTSKNPNDATSAIENLAGGTISANGGKVILTAQVMDNLFANAVNNEGVIEANELNEEGLSRGKVSIDANADIVSTGSIEANEIDVKGKNVLVDGGDVLATSSSGEASIDIEATAGNINVINHSNIKAEVNDVGSASVDLFATHYFGESLEDSDEGSSLIGGTLTIMDSTVEALVHNAPEVSEDSLEAKVLYVKPLIGEATINLNSDYRSELGHGDVNVNNSSVTAKVDGVGRAYINIGRNEDANVNIENSSKILASIGNDLERATAYIGIDANKITIDNSSLRAETTNPEAYGHARIDLDARYNDSVPAEITIKNLSTLEADVAGWGDAEIDLSASNYGGCLGIDADMPASTLTIDHSMLTANVANGGEAEIDMEADQVDILANSEILSQSNGKGYAGIEIEGQNVNLDNAWLTSRAMGYADIEIDAYGGDIDIFASHMTAESTYVDAIIELYAEGSDYISKEAKISKESSEEVLGGNINIDMSILKSTAVDGDARIVAVADAGIDINRSTLQALVTVPTEYCEAEIYLNPTGNVSADVNISQSVISSQIMGSGHAAVYIYNRNGDLFDSDSLEVSDGMGGFLYELLDMMGGPVNGSINITDSEITASASTSEYNGDETGLVYMFAADDINISNSLIAASEADGFAVIGMLAGGNINIDEGSLLTANSNMFSAVAGFARGSITLKGAIATYGGMGGSAVVLGALGDVDASGDILAAGTFDTIGFLNSIMGDGLFIDLGINGTLSSVVLLGSVFGDVTLGNISADLVVAAALMGQEYYTLEKYIDEVSSDIPMGGNIYGTKNGLVSARYLAMLARRNIGTADQPINTAVDVVSGYSWDVGDIYLNEADDITLGMYIPVMSEEGLIFSAGLSLAANDGIVHVESQGDITVNSIITPRGGVYLKSFNGSIYAGHGWDARLDYEQIYGISSCASYVLYNLADVELNPEMIGYYLSEFMMESPIMEGVFYSPIMLGMPMEDGPNVVAGGYSYFSTPNGTIGVGSADDKDTSVSGQIMGFVAPGVTAVTGLNPSVDLDLRFGPPPGTVYFNNLENENGPQQVWPAAVTPVVPNVNPLKVDINVIEGGKSALPAGFAPVNPAGLTLQIGSVVPNNDSVDPGIFANALLRDARAYYEFLEKFRFQGFEPIVPTGFYAYHPLISTDMNAFDQFNLDAGAYDFIDGNIQYNDEAKKKKTLL